MNKIIKQLTRFLGVGVIATIIDFLVLYIVHSLLGMHYLIGTTAGFVVSTIYNYWASMRYVFKSKVKEGDRREKRREFMTFLLLSVIGLALTNLLMSFMVSYLSFPVAISKVLTTGIVMVFNFITRKLFLEGDGDD